MTTFLPKFITLTQVGDYGDEVTIAVDSIVVVEQARISNGYGGKRKVTNIHLNNNQTYSVTESTESIMKLLELKKESHD